MRLIDEKKDPTEWVDLPDGGRLRFRIPSWEDHDRAISRVANATEAKHDATDVLREMAVSQLVEQEGFGSKGGNGKPVPATIPDDAARIVASLSLADMRAVEAALYPRIEKAEADLGN